MNATARAEELTLRTLDGLASEAEAVELEDLVERDPSAAEAHLLMMKQEAILRGDRTGFDLAPATLQRLPVVSKRRPRRAFAIAAALVPVAGMFIWILLSRDRIGQFNPFTRSGAWMFSILLVSITTLALIVERIVTLWFRYRLDPHPILDAVLACVDANDPGAALAVCDRRRGDPLCHVLRAGLLKADRSELFIRRALEEGTRQVTPLLQKRTPYLATLANVATLLGLLGTIFGLIMAFEGVEAASAAKKQEVLAHGISLAMNTTAFGLIVAIPTAIAHAIFKARQNRLQDMIEDSARTLLDRLAAKSG